MSNSNEVAAGLPKFEVCGVEFECFVARDQEGTPFIWRSGCNRARVGKRIVLVDAVDEETGEITERCEVTCWARFDGHLIGSEFASLKIAMIAAAAKVPVQVEVAA